MAKLRLERVTKIFDRNIHGAKDITFEAEDKEFVVLVGPSGCGKTTILRLIAGLEQPTSGNVYIDGECINDIPPRDRNVAMVFQNYALYPHMDVYENMAFGLKVRGYPAGEIEARVKNAAELLGLSKYLKRKPGQLSGGQRQRVALGRAIVREPRLFLFDEPLSNLDAKLRVQMRSELARLHKRLSATIIYVTHDQVEAMTLGQKIIVLKDGVIQQIADPLTLYQSPANKFVAGFIGSPPMNFIPGKIKEVDNLPVFVHPSLNLKLNRKFLRFINREVELGIRPDDFSRNHGLEIQMIVDVVEPMGNERYIYGHCGDIMLSARIQQDEHPESDKPFRLTIAPEKIYLFDAQTEKRL
ncbi:glycerol-3-phosphate ABC transporter ATP-binding protein [candidate division WOR-3 bacterium 4484_100]|uniref:Glycerol-3-phosphate ABC transporter ATP-binding protein n=1 Tax=candidate division WOR-3 bacterium 4484_100 TaxID=1936077 RepID=A0A1V4QHZ4_UNCW3|nr:MAG: glycerol-3-phosphate ABC transporter ATP-binding protein [candidate division WOR-3 bacterium 4484_100]